MSCAIHTAAGETTRDAPRASFAACLPSASQYATCEPLVGGEYQQKTVWLTPPPRYLEGNLAKIGNRGAVQDVLSLAFVDDSPPLRAIDPRRPQYGAQPVARETERVASRVVVGTERGDLYVFHQAPSRRLVERGGRRCLNPKGMAFSRSPRDAHRRPLAACLPPPQPRVSLAPAPSPGAPHPAPATPWWLVARDPQASDAEAAVAFASKAAASRRLWDSSGALVGSVPHSAEAGTRYCFTKAERDAGASYAGPLAHPGSGVTAVAWSARLRRLARADACSATCRSKNLRILKNLKI